MCVYCALPVGSTRTRSQETTKAGGEGERKP